MNKIALTTEQYKAAIVLVVGVAGILFGSRAGVDPVALTAAALVIASYILGVKIEDRAR